MVAPAAPAIAEEGPAHPANGDEDDENGAMALWPSQKMKLSPYPLTFHTECFLMHEDDVRLGQPDGLNIGDIIEISHSEEWYEQFSPEIRPPKLILQISKSIIMPGTGPSIKKINRGTFYLEQSISDSFKFNKLKDIYVRQITTEHIKLSSVELTFHDQYLSRSEMWRLKSALIDSCVFINKKVDTCQGSIRCQVNNMRAESGVRMACGLITQDTKFVFRSQTAMIYLFIQMSSEMWESDQHGCLYFENAVDGFLASMFNRWQKAGSSHEVTIVLFSRCFYDAQSKDELPEHMRECVQTGFNGRFYEDFYRVVVQNERFDDWSPTLCQLRAIFPGYQDWILNYHKRLDEPEVIVPEARISRAEEGNFLEVLNMSLNTFENHFLNRNLDRTGQQSLVLTPGVGLFSVDREFSQVTKQRIIDSGVGSDLICLGEHPLHAVPLLHFYKNEHHKSEFSMPHWINLSFYHKAHPEAPQDAFTPRVKKPSELPTFDETGSHLNMTKVPRIPPPDDNDATADRCTLFCMAYDEAIFAEVKTPPLQAPTGAAAAPPPTSALDRTFERISKSDVGGGARRKNSSPDVNQGAGGSQSRQQRNAATIATSIYSSSLTERASVLPPLMNFLSKPNQQAADAKDSKPTDEVGKDKKKSAAFDHETIKQFLLQPGRALVNPFDPKNTTSKLTSNRRRWTHIFPEKVQNDSTEDEDAASIANKLAASVQFDEDSNGIAVQGASAIPWTPELKTLANADTKAKVKANSEQGVDWRSLTIPAALPLTTDFCPDDDVFDKEYLLNEYEIFTDDLEDQDNTSLPKMTMLEVFSEMISQRLAQGFQIVLKEDGRNLWKKSNHDAAGGAKRHLSARQVCWLSIGRIFHCVALVWNRTNQRQSIQVIRHSPRQSSKGAKVHYRYRFQAPDNDRYELSWVDFQTEKLENYNWNRMDLYVSTRGWQENYTLNDALKFWRFRMFILPTTPAMHAVTKSIVDGSQQRCDVFPPLIDGATGMEEIEENFYKFVDLCMNKWKRVARGALVKEPQRKDSKSAKPEKEQPKQAKIEANASPKEVFQKFANDPDLIVVNSSSLPANTFVSHDAICWAKRNFAQVMSTSEAVNLFQKMVDAKLLIHASGDKRVPFKPGYFLFTFASSPIADSMDLETFRRLWMEVDISLSRNDVYQSRGSLHGNVDPNSKSSRPEWGHVEFQSVLKPGHTFDMSLQWAVASGALMGELVQTWARKAQSYTKHVLVPVPHDPFALPITMNSDPVRGPIFIEMNLDFLGSSHRIPEERMFAFRELIAEKFGFIPCYNNEGPQNKGRFSLNSNCSGTQPLFNTEHQYFHCTGNMSLLIPRKIGLSTDSGTGIQGVKSHSTPGGKQSSSPIKAGQAVSSPMKTEGKELSSHLSEKEPEYDHSQTGFLWSWNFMISRRWKQITITGGTGDIAFMDKMLRDFRNLCSNEDGRLEELWSVANL